MEVICQQISVAVEKRPKRGDVCLKCGADHDHYEKHPTLIGGNCTVCGDVWLPGLTFGKPETIYHA